MKNRQVLHKFDQIMCIWQDELNKYSLESLKKKPTPNSWSLGQVYVHLIDGTLNFHLQQAEHCLSKFENDAKRKNFKGFITYHVLGSIPPIQIKVPPSEGYTPKQPEGIEEIKEGLMKVKAKMHELLDPLSVEKQGKTTHPGFSYLNGNEWYRLVEMHYRHHLRQKERIDAFLKNAG